MKRKALFVFYASENGRDGWTLVKPDDLPTWVKDPDVLGNLVNGMVAFKCDEGEKGSLHYRAEAMLGSQAGARRKKAQDARELRAANKLLMQLPADQPILIDNSEFVHYETAWTNQLI